MKLQSSGSLTYGSQNTGEVGVGGRDLTESLLFSAPGSREVSPANANPGAEEKVAEPTVRVIENKVIVNPRLFAEERAVVEDTGDQEPGIRASSDTSR